MDTTNLIVYLPFDISTTQDLCGNTWTASGSPDIVDGQLSLNGASYLQNDSIASAIDDDIWAIQWRGTSTVNSGEQYFFGTFNANYGTSGTGTNKWIAVNFYDAKPTLVLFGNDSTVNVTLNRNQSYHYALSYDGTALRLFIDGVLRITKIANVKLGGAFRIGCTGGRTNSADFFRGFIDEFIILKGVAWTENFTPPTDEDYEQLKLELGKPFSLEANLERVITNAAWKPSMNLKAWLPFNRTPTEDLCGNEWHGDNPVFTREITADGAINGNALQVSYHGSTSDVLTYCLNMVGKVSRLRVVLISSHITTSGTVMVIGDYLFYLTH